MNQKKRDTQLEGITCMTVIMQAKQRYLVELRCRELEVAFTNYINAAIDICLKDANTDQYANNDLWHDDPAIRLYRLATSRPDLLAHSERLLWRSILKEQRVYADGGALCPEKISQQWQRLIVGF